MITQHAEADLRIQLFSINPDIKKVCKNVTVTLLPTFLDLKSYFSQKLLFMLTCNEFITSQMS